MKKIIFVLMVFPLVSVFSIWFRESEIFYNKYRYIFEPMTAEKIAEYEKDRAWYAKQTKREKYPSKIFLPGEEVYGKKFMEVCFHKPRELYINWLCLAEEGRFDTEPFPPIDTDMVRKNGYVACVRPACQRFFDEELEMQLIKYITKKLSDDVADQFGKIYPYLSDYYKEFFFNAAVQYNQPRIVKHFIDQGIDVNAEMPGTILIMTFSASYGEVNPDIHESLKKKSFKVRGIKPIEAAREYGYTEIIKLLEESGRLKDE
jgi:hypothetical protein